MSPDLTLVVKHVDKTYSALDSWLLNHMESYSLLGFFFVGAFQVLTNGIPWFCSVQTLKGTSIFTSINPMFGDGIVQHSTSWTILLVRLVIDSIIWEADIMGPEMITNGTSLMRHFTATYLAVSDQPKQDLAASAGSEASAKAWPGASAK